MAQTGHLTATPRPAAPWLTPVTWLRIAILLTLLAIWEAVAASGILLRDVVPSTLTIGKALVELLFQPDLKVSLLGHDLTIPAFYWHLYVTIYEVVTALLIGGSTGLAIGIALGANPFLARAFERYLYYLGPTPKIVFFPVMIMWFGVGPESKIAMGTVSCFFPVVLSAAAGMRQIEGVLIRVGRSFRLNTWQMVSKIYLPAMREPIVNGARPRHGRCHDRYAARGDQALEQGRRFHDHRRLQHLRHAAHVRGVAGVVRDRDRSQRPGQGA